MATNIPPHNLGEVCTALVKLLDNEDIGNAQLCRYIKGPDFPTGGQILNSQEELKEIYKTGIGIDPAARHLGPSGPKRARRRRSTSTAFRTRSTRRSSSSGSRTSSSAASCRQLLDVKDLSTEDVRIALEMKKDADEKMIMAYLFKHTPLQINFAVNLTCLVPTENPDVGRPERLDLKQILWHFLHFRLEVVTRRLEHELAALKKRIHILEGFEKVFDALDEIIRIIRKSDGKADAAEKIMKRFELDADQTDAILELKIYRLARLEILIIRDELDEKRKRARQISALLKDEDSRWKLVRGELEEMRKAYADPKVDKRRTTIESDTDEPEYSADDFIVEEDNVVIVSRDGWVKRQKEVKDLATTRLREGDSVLAAFAGSTRATLRVLFSNFGIAYTSRIIDVPASTGYGEPIQRFFKLKDGEKIVAALSLDPRAIGDIRSRAGGPLPSPRPCTPSPSRATATPALRPRGVRRAEHARRHGATRGRLKARRSSASRSSPDAEVLIAATAAGARPALQGRRSELPVRARARASS